MEDARPGNHLPCTPGGHIHRPRRFLTDMKTIEKTKCRIWRMYVACNAIGSSVHCQCLLQPCINVMLFNHTVRHNNFLNLENAFLGVPELGIRRRAWGRVHLMRSGKRSAAPVSWHPVQSEEMDGPDYDVERSLSSMGVERADLGIGIQPLSSLVLRRVTT